MKKIFLTAAMAAAISCAFAQQDNTVPPQQVNTSVQQMPPPQQRPVSSSPRTRINLYGAYVFDDGFESYYSDYDYYYGTLEGGFMGGAGLEFLLKPNSAIELHWLHQETNAPTYYQRDIGLSTNYDNFVVGLDYIMLGFNRLMANASGKVEGYGGLSLGMAIVGIDSPSRGASGSVDKFAWGLKLGANIWATPRVGIKLQAHLLSIVDGAGGGLYFGTGGAGVGVSTYSTFYQFGLGGGLTFKVGS